MLRVKKIEIVDMHKHPGRVVFEPKPGATYIYGPNGAGKSTILQAIQLALLGYIPGTGKKPADIMKHSCGYSLVVSVHLSDDAGRNIRITRQWGKVGSSVSSDLQVEPASAKDNIADLIKDIELPVFNFNSFIGMTANQLKDWFISFLPQPNNEMDWSEELKRAVGSTVILDDGLVSDVLKAIGDKKGVDAAAAANAYIKQLKQSITREIAAYEGTLATMVYYDDVDSSLTLEDITAKRAAINARIDALHKYESQVLNRNFVISQNQSFHARLNDLPEARYASVKEFPEYVDTLVTLDELHAQRAREASTESIEALVKEEVQLKEAIYATQQNIKTLERLIQSSGVCPYTEHVCESIQQKIEKEFKGDLEAAEDSLKQLEARLADIQAGLDKLYDRKKEIELSIRKYEENKSVIERKFVERDQVLSSMLPVPEVTEIAETSTLAELEEESKKLDTLLWKLGANMKFAEIQDHVFVDIAKAKQNLEVVKIWDKYTGVNGVQTQLMYQPFSEASTKLTEYLKELFPGFCTFQFEMTDKANSFSFGIQRGRNYISYEVLSSGEKCLFTVALLNYILEMSGSEVKLLLLDDIFDHLDDDNMDRVLRFASESSDVQYIIAGAKKPSESVEPSIVVELPGGEQNA